MYNIKGKTAIVTGSASGLGAAIVEKLADEGVNVVVSSSHKHDDTDEVLDKLKNKGVKAIYIPCDVSDEKQIENLFNESLKEMGQVDYIVNNAAIWLTSYIKDMSIEDFRKTLDVNLVGPFVLSKLFLNYCLDNKRKGKIVNLTSQAAFHGSTSGHAHYAASKAGLVGFTVSMAREAAPYGVNVNAIAPGIMETQLVSAIVDDPDRRKKYEERIPLGRIATVEEIARIALFLLSPESDYMTGATLDATGGMLMR